MADLELIDEDGNRVQLVALLRIHNWLSVWGKIAKGVWWLYKQPVRWMR